MLGFVNIIGHQGVDIPEHRSHKTSSLADNDYLFFRVEAKTKIFHHLSFDKPCESEVENNLGDWKGAP